MFAIHVPTWIRRVASPMSCAVAITSLLTSAAKIASNPATSASRATVCTSLALQPTPGTTASASRSAICLLLLDMHRTLRGSYRQSDTGDHRHRKNTAAHGEQTPEHGFGMATSASEVRALGNSLKRLFFATVGGRAPS